MYIQWYELVFITPIFQNFLELCTYFIVQYLDLYMMSPIRQFFMFELYARICVCLLYWQRGLSELCLNHNDMQSLCIHFHFLIWLGICHNHQCIVCWWDDPICGVLVFLLWWNIRCVWLFLYCSLGGFLLIVVFLIFLLLCWSYSLWWFHHVAFYSLNWMWEIFFCIVVS